jgi:uncharacterized protein YdaU (DUF1376 family)
VADDEKNIDSWMPIYIGDYLADTMHFTTEQHGAYLLLIFHHWRSGPIPDDDESLAAITKMALPAWRKFRPKIEPKFMIADGFWTQKRALREKEKAAGVSNKRRDAANKRWSGEGDAPSKVDAKGHAKGDAKPDAKRMQTGMQNTYKRHDNHSHSHKEIKEKAAASFPSPLREASANDPKPPETTPPPPLSASPPEKPERPPPTADPSADVAALLVARGVPVRPENLERLAREGRTAEQVAAAITELEERGKSFTAALVADVCADAAAPRIRGVASAFPHWRQDPGHAAQLCESLGIPNARPGESADAFHRRVLDEIARQRKIAL